MKPDYYKLLSMCVEAGVAAGYRMAHKHTDEPSEEYVLKCIEESVMSEISDWFHFTEVK